MKRLLIVYGTTDGHTAKIARVLGNEFRRLGTVAHVAHAATEDPDPAAYDGTVVAASVVMGHFQRPIRRWVRAHRSALAARPNAFLSVCLGILQEQGEVHQDLALIANRFFTRTGWTPRRVEFVAGALPYTRYGWLKRWGMLRVVRKARGDTDTTRDHEYTDWNRVRVFARGMVAGLKCAAARKPEEPEARLPGGADPAEVNVAERMTVPS